MNSQMKMTHEGGKSSRILSAILQKSKEWQELLFAETFRMSDWMDAEAHADRAFELYERGRWAEAESELRKALSLNPDQPEWHFNLGLTLEAAGRDGDALAAYEQATTLMPGQPEGQFPGPQGSPELFPLEPVPRLPSPPTPPEPRPSRPGTLRV
jgi:Flp pilus assembly protein TadD